jgi:hypothetical protein
MSSDVEAPLLSPDGSQVWDGQAWKSLGREGQHRKGSARLRYIVIAVAAVVLAGAAAAVYAVVGGSGSNSQTLHGDFDISVVGASVGADTPNCTKFSAHLNVLDGAGTILATVSMPTHNASYPGTDGKTIFNVCRASYAVKVPNRPVYTATSTGFPNNNHQTVNSKDIKNGELPTLEVLYDGLTPLLGLLGP